MDETINVADIMPTDSKNGPGGAVMTVAKVAFVAMFTLSALREAGDMFDKTVTMTDKFMRKFKKTTS